MSIAELVKKSKSVNLAKGMGTDLLTKIGENAVRRAVEDDASREEWKKRSKDAMDLALQTIEKKDFPFENASNIKFPIVTTTALQFHARIMPAILSGNKIAKAKVTGSDPEGAKEQQAVRVSNYMNYQLIEEMQDWESDMDSMLLALPIEGCEFKKTYFSPELKTNVSEWIRPENLIVHYKTKKFSTCQRITHVINLYPQQIQEKVRAGLWLDVDLNISKDDIEDEELQEFYEQHCLLDLDEDGYKEPYCVTVHKESRKVVRIKASYYPEDIKVRINGEEMTAADRFPGEQGKITRIVRNEYFTKYSFIPSPDGGFYDIGIGQIIGPLNHSISSILNQIVDAGTLANTQGGFTVDGVSVGNQRGNISWKMGEFKKIKTPHNMPIQQAIMPFNFGGPSAVLFNVLGLLIQATKDAAGVQDIHSGGVGVQETATTTMARIEEGQKVFNATFKRIYRGLTEELRKLKKLNSIYLEPETYFRVLDTNEEGVVTLSDFRNDGTDVQPVGDPSMANTAQRIAKAEALFGMIQNPYLNGEEVTRRYLEAIEVANVDALMNKEESPEVQQIKMQAEQMMQEMTAQAEQMQAALADAEARANTEQQKVEIEKMKIEVASFKAETERLRSQVDASIKQAEADNKDQIDKFKAEIDAFNAETNRMKLDMDSKTKETEAIGMMEELFSKLEEKEDEDEGEEPDDKIEKLIEQMNRPKKIVRDDSGNITGVE